MLISGRPSVLKCFSALSANSVIVIFDASLDSFIVKKNAHSKERYNCDHPCYYNNYPCIPSTLLHFYQYTLVHTLKRQKCANFDSIFMHKHIMLTRTTSCEIYSLLDLTNHRISYIINIQHCLQCLLHVGLTLHNKEPYRERYIRYAI